MHSRRLLALCFVIAFAIPAGAETPDGARHWSFQPVRRPDVPPVVDPAWVRTPIDAFVLARLEAARCRPVPLADKAALLRRVYLDLIGLPPTPDEQARFRADGRADAFARVVDQLLARPEYGERWARHWLDVARYADTNGYERDGDKPNAWRYRDYVIDAFNRDKPYDRFVTEQIAGDELSNASAESMIATTFLRLGTWDDEPANPRVDRYDQLDDVLGTTAAAFLGVTLRCARCHDHKFEPFSQADYYRILSVFEPLQRPQQDRADLDRPVGTYAQLEASRKVRLERDASLALVKKELDELDACVRTRLLDGKSAPKSAMPSEVIEAFRTAAAARNAKQKLLVKRFTAKLTVEMRAAATASERRRRTELETQRATLTSLRPGEPPHAYIWFEDGAKAPITHVLKRGNPEHPGAVATPGIPAVLVSTQPPPPNPTSRSTGRRLWLAQWLTRRDNPLTARVIVNRVWQHHFGVGLVATPSDFGVMGQRPTHPLLLDWLADWFMANGWQLKPLHRLIVLSSVYQTSAAANDAAAAGKESSLAVEELLGRWRQHRLDAEAVRDSILSVSGQLNPEKAGPGVYPPLPAAVHAGQSRPGQGWKTSGPRAAARRSIYVFLKRSLVMPELELLDAADNTSSCDARPVSTTAPQALTFLNGAFLTEQAGHFAARLRREAGEVPAGQVRRAFALALCRPPAADELARCLDFLVRQQTRIVADEKNLPEEAARRRALAALCLVLLNTNEFVYPR